MAYTITTQNTTSQTAGGGSYIGSGPFTALVDNDRISYVSHGWQLLLSELRTADHWGTDKPSRPFLMPSLTEYVALSVGNIFTVPFAVPGTNNLSSNTAGDTGSLQYSFLLRNAQGVVRLRKIAGINNDGTLDTPGAWTSSSVTESSSTWTWKTGQISFPTTTSAGDLYQIEVFGRSNTVVDGGISAYMVWEPVLQSADP